MTLSGRKQFTSYVLSSSDVEKAILSQDRQEGLQSLPSWIPICSSFLGALWIWVRIYGTEPPKHLRFDPLAAKRAWYPFVLQVLASINEGSFVGSFKVFLSRAASTLGSMLGPGFRKFPIENPLQLGHSR